MFGSARRCSRPWKGLIAASWIGAPVRSRTISVRATCTVFPFACRMTSSIVLAIPSTAPTETASLAGDERASATVETAQSTGRWRTWAIEVTQAIASFLTFSPSVPGMSCPEESIGEAAPIRVPGAMYARLAERVMNVPALAAYPPDGATQTMTGNRASRIAETIFWVDSRLPPGVFTLITTAFAPPSAAPLSDPCRYSAMIGSTMPVVGRTTTEPAVAAWVGAARISRPTRDRNAAMTGRRRSRWCLKGDLLGSSYCGSHLEPFEGDPAPGLEAIADRGDLRGRRESPAQLVILADCDRTAGGIAFVYQPELDLTDRGRVVVEQTDEPELRDELDDELLVPFAAEGRREIAVEAAVLRVDVPAHADRE